VSDLDTHTNEQIDASRNGPARYATVAGVRGPVAIPSDPCDTPLPIGPIVDTYTYSQIVALAAIDETTGNSRRAVVPTVVAGALGPIMAEGNVDATVGDLVGGVMPLNGSADVRLARTVHVEDINRLLADQRVEIDDRSVRVSLGDRAVRRLLAGQPSVVTPQDGAGLLQPLAANGDGEDGQNYDGQEESPFLHLMPPAEARAPAGNRFAVTDLAAFLAAPALPATGGGEIPVHLDADAVQALRRGGTHVTLPGERSVELVLDATSLRVSARRPLPTAVIALGEQEDTSEDLEGGELAGILNTAAAPLVLWLPWTQRWTLTGYARGELLTTSTPTPSPWRRPPCSPLGARSGTPPAACTTPASPRPRATSPPTRKPKSGTDRPKRRCADGCGERGARSSGRPAPGTSGATPVSASARPLRVLCRGPREPGTEGGHRWSS
jgi:hypothetical protein